MSRRNFTQKQKQQIVERAKRDKAGPRSKSRSLKWIETMMASERLDVCIEWPFSSRESGYGQIFYDGKRTTSNRLICQLAHGPAPEEKHHAAHECGNRRCCNPDHISWKTVTENADDRKRHGTQPIGSGAYNAKLTERDVVRIRALSAIGMSLTGIAEIHGISFQTVSDIKNNKCWRHV